MSIRDVKVSFDLGFRRGQVYAVNGVDLEIEPSTTLGLIGESGSGKTTLSQVMALLERPSSGRIEFEGDDITDIRGRRLKRLRKDIAIVPQDSSSSLDPRMTIGASLLEPQQVQRIGTAATRQRAVEEALDLVSLGAEFLDRYPHELSGGQKQRANIARALTLDPKLLICDEVVSALDVSLQAGILNLLRRIQRERGISMVFVSHDLSVVSHLSHQVAVLYLGQLMEVGPTDQVMSTPMHPYTRALLESRPIPVPKSMQPDIRLIEGDIPSPSAPPPGCVFATRCPFAQNRCTTERPEAFAATATHVANCHFVETVAKVPLQVPLH